MFQLPPIVCIVFSKWTLTPIVRSTLYDGTNATTMNAATTTFAIAINKTTTTKKPHKGVASATQQTRILSNTGEGLGFGYIVSIHYRSNSPLSFACFVFGRDRAHVKRSGACGCASASSCSSHDVHCDWLARATAGKHFWHALTYELRSASVMRCSRCRRAASRLRRGAFQSRTLETLTSSKAMR